MAFKKNKRRFDPRYFMDEKTEEPLKESGKRPSLRIPGTDPAADRWHREQEQAARDKEEEKRKASGPIDDNAGRFGAIPEGLEQLADPAVWEILALATGKLFSIWAPLFGIAGFAMVMKDALEFLKGNQNPSAQEAESAVLAAVDGASEDSEV
jgi:hypothetical protein